MQTEEALTRTRPRPWCRLVTAAAVSLMLIAAGVAWSDSHDAADCIEPAHRLPKHPQFGLSRFTNRCEVPVMVAWCIPPEVRHDYDWDEDPRCGYNDSERQPYYTDTVNIGAGDGETVLMQYAPTVYAACYAGHVLTSNAEGYYTGTPPPSRQGNPPRGGSG